MRAFVVDAYDSFVYIIVQYIETLGIDVTIERNDVVNADRIREVNPDFVVLGPGPGHPADAGYVELLRELGESTPFFGVCLGHQAIGLAYGGEIARADHLMHGKTSEIKHDNNGVFAKHNNPFKGTRYHSLIVDKASVPDVLTVSATAEDDGYVMGLRHKELPIESVQFHPESILTEEGLDLFRSFIATHVQS